MLLEFQASPLRCQVKINVNAENHVNARSDLLDFQLSSGFPNFVF